MSEHVIPKRTYYTIFAILMGCTGLTVAIASVDLGTAALNHAPSAIHRLPIVVSLIGNLNAVAALTIAVFKATLVVLFFMHVRSSTRLTWAVVLGSVFWLGILLVLTMTDYVTRVCRTFG